MDPHSYPSFARHHVERCTRIGNARTCVRVRYCTRVHTLKHTHARAQRHAHTSAEHTCAIARSWAHEDVSRHRHVWPLYRVNVRSNALLNNVRRYTYASVRRRAKNIHLARALCRSLGCERTNERVNERANATDRTGLRSAAVRLLAEFRVRAVSPKNAIDFFVHRLYYGFTYRCDRPRARTRSHAGARNNRR